MRNTEACPKNVKAHCLWVDANGYRDDTCCVSVKKVGRRFTENNASAFFASDYGALLEKATRVCHVYKHDDPCFVLQSGATSIPRSEFQRCCTGDLR